MKRFFTLAALLWVALAAVSCRQTPQIRLSGSVDSMKDSLLVLKVLNFSETVVVDTLQVDQDGQFAYTFEAPATSPNYYYLYSGARKMVSLILSQGDNVTLTVKDNACVVEGSEQTQWLHQAERELAVATAQFDSLSVLYTHAKGKEQEALSRELANVFVKYKQQAIRFFYTHPYAFANTAVAFYTLPGQLYLFADYKDAALMRRVYDSLYVTFPTSGYVAAVRDRAEDMEKALQFQVALAEAEEADFPEICLPDQNGRMQCLSAFKGRPTVLAFWLSNNVDMRLDNQELLNIYRDYNRKNLAIYQVALDTDKAQWASLLREQEVPWVSVCDGLGLNSRPVTMYNVTQLPTYFVIDKEATLVARVTTLEDLEAELKKLK